ncbi:MAG: N-(5'-phosphoribosyl)anthranilate isomerase [Gemmatimonadales bacterium]
MRVKICGLMRREDALAADEAGADYLGVVLTSGFGRSVAPRSAGAIVAGTRALKVAVLVDESPDDVAGAADALRADVVQLSGDESITTVEAIRTRGPWSIWKAVRARSVEELEAAIAHYARSVDAILLEGWKDGSKGGSGARVALDAARVRALVPRELDFVLAGGLGPDNVADAVRAFQPDVVDVSSGVERALGAKDHERVHAFVEAARGATAAAPR